MRVGLRDSKPPPAYSVGKNVEVDFKDEGTWIDAVITQVKPALTGVHKYSVVCFFQRHDQHVCEARIAAPCLLATVSYDN